MMLLLQNPSFRVHLPGFVAAAAVALLALCVQQLAAGLSELFIALILGLALRALLSARLAQAAWQPGFLLLKTTVLRAGIVLFGFRLSWQQLSQLGWQGILIDLLMLSSTFCLALWLGRRLGVDKGLATLIGAGSAICGAAAVMATASTLRSNEAHSALAIGTVVLFGSVAMLLYPLVYPWWLLLGGDAQSMGVLIGSTVHEVAQVVVAGQAISGDVAEFAVLSKLGRVLLLAPFLVVVMLLQRRAANAAQPAAVSSRGAALPVPWFAIGSLGCCVWQSLSPLPELPLQAVLSVDRACLVLAMAALGLSTCFRQLGQFGYKPLFLGALLACWLLIVGGFLNIFLYC